MMPLPETKLAKLKRMMAAGDTKGALRLAAKFGRLGERKEVIQRGWAALCFPDFYVALDESPATHVAAGIAAIKERYGL
jgi:hypothetical protein